MIRPCQLHPYTYCSRITVPHYWYTYIVLLIVGSFIFIKNSCPNYYFLYSHQIYFWIFLVQSNLKFGVFINIENTLTRSIARSTLSTDWHRHKSFTMPFKEKRWIDKYWKLQRHKYILLCTNMKNTLKAYV